MQGCGLAMPHQNTKNKNKKMVGQRLPTWHPVQHATGTTYTPPTCLSSVKDEYALLYIIKERSPIGQSAHPIYKKQQAGNCVCHSDMAAPVPSLVGMQHGTATTHETNCLSFIWEKQPGPLSLA